jgi:hypothetical protein
MDTTVIEYPASGETYSHDEYGVYRYSTYEEGSVLAGQEKRTFLDGFETLEEAQAAYPEAEWSGDSGSGYREVYLPVSPPEWFDPSYAGERWEEDY